MSNTMFFSLFLNIGLLVLIATLLTKTLVVRNMLLGYSNLIGSRVALVVIFDLASISSTYTGVRVQGAIVNAGAIGVLAAGFLDGPYMGMGAAIIGGLRRCLLDINEFTAVSCTVFTFVEGLTESVFSRRFKAEKIDNTSAFLITALAEVGQTLIIVPISKPFPAALELVQLIAFPMVITNALEMVAFIATSNTVFMKRDSQSTEKMRLALGIVEQSLPHLRRGLYSARDMEATAKIIYNSTACTAVMITNTQRILTMKGDARYNDLKRDATLKSILGSIHNKEPTTFSYAEEPDSLYHIPKNHIIVAAPLIEMGKPIGNLTMVVRKHWHTPQSNLNFASELARPFSTQLELSDLDYQKQLRREAKFKALQSQVNPYPLYSALNIIPCVCQESPEQARGLIRTLPPYYRQTPENGQYVLGPHTEPYHISSYPELEKARFGGKLQVTMDVEEDINCTVPSFILQPLVENAVRYGTDKKGQRSVSIGAHGAGNPVKVAVTSKGPGFPMEVVKQLHSNERRGSVDLKNIHRRLKSIYGEDNGLKIKSSQDGFRVWFRAPM